MDAAKVPLSSVRSVVLAGDENGGSVGRRDAATN